ncbi:MAG: dipeptidase [Planctomycetota bacterium]
MLFSLLAILTQETAFAQEVHSPESRKPVVLSDAALEIHRSSYVWDGHNDLPWAIRGKAGSSFVAMDIAEDRPELHTDIPRLIKGNVGAQFWSVYVPASLRKTGEAFQVTMEQIELVKRMCERYPDTFHLALTSSDVKEARRKGQIASLIGMEGGHSIENSIANLRRLHAAGARYMTLTHSATLDWADSATDDQPHNGLTDFGKEVVREMNRLGMLVDLSHVSPQVMRDAMEVSTAPIIYSHSSAKAITGHERNVPDDVFPLIRKNGGIVMVNFFSGYILSDAANWMKEIDDLREKWQEETGGDEREVTIRTQTWVKRNPPPKGSVHDVVDHIDHLAKGIGIDHVGLGSDYDGVPQLPEQLEDVSMYPYITQVMLDRGYSAAEIRKVMSENMMRVLEQAEAAAAR